ncbi:hypothetical protein PSEUDO9AG_20160 [Pseudomonas sp. 9Ag]|nr:hypothetical protein PSEUDO9AG_20160 [Pseudomonas sp. 9Ag]
MLHIVKAHSFKLVRMSIQTLISYREKLILRDLLHTIAPRMLRTKRCAVPNRILSIPSLQCQTNRQTVPNSARAYTAPSFRFGGR